MVTFKDIDDPKIVGYLGNNLFQLATSYNLAFKNRDVLTLPKFEYCDIFENKFFEIQDKETIQKQIKREYNEPYFQHKEIPYSKDMNLNGYFQSPKYFDKLITKFNFKLKSKIQNSILSTINNQTGKSFDELFAYHRVTSIHVRRGDYISLSNVFVNLFEGDYYEKAIEKLQDVTDYFLIFSNDIPFCKEYFKGDKFIFSESIQEKSQGNQSSVHDLYLGSYCNNNIIANSSFSWWQGFLNDSPYKKVVYPKNWFRPGLHHILDLFPNEKNWILIQ